MKKYSVLFIIFILVLLACSCTNSAPDLFLSFEILDYADGGSSVDVDYKLTNGGESSLENCKIQFGVDTEAGTGTTYLEINKKWTSGVDLSVGESHTDSISVPYSLGTFQGIDVIASGWDDPEDKAAGTKIIYFNE